MKKVILILLIILLSGCNNIPSGEVNAYLNEYKNMDSSVKEQINHLMEQVYLNEENIKVYKEVYAKQYRNMTYDIKDYTCDKKVCNVPVIIEVYDYITVQNEAMEYLIANETEFLDENNNYDMNKYEYYKLNLMLQTDKRIKYEINFHLEKHLTNWYITSITNQDLLKIHGLY